MLPAQYGPAASLISDYPSISTWVNRQGIGSDSFHPVGHSKFARNRIEIDHLSNILRKLYMFSLHLIIVWNSRLILRVYVLEWLSRAYLSVGSHVKRVRFVHTPDFWKDRSIFPTNPAPTPRYKIPLIVGSPQHDWRVNLVLHA